MPLRLAKEQCRSSRETRAFGISLGEVSPFPIRAVKAYFYMRLSWAILRRRYRWAFITGMAQVVIILWHSNITRGRGSMASWKAVTMPLSCCTSLVGMMRQKDYTDGILPREGRLRGTLHFGTAMVLPATA